MNCTTLFSLTMQSHVCQHRILLDLQITYFVDIFNLEQLQLTELSRIWCTIYFRGKNGGHV